MSDAHGFSSKVESEDDGTIELRILESWRSVGLTLNGQCHCRGLDRRFRTGRRPPAALPSAVAASRITASSGSHPPRASRLLPSRTRLDARTPALLPECSKPRCSCNPSAQKEE